MKIAEEIPFIIQTANKKLSFEIPTLNGEMEEKFGQFIFDDFSTPFYAEIMCYKKIIRT